MSQPVMPSLLYDDVQDRLREELRKALDKHCGSPALHRLIDVQQSHDAALWQLIAGEMGLAGLLIPEQLGGGGATLREAAVVMEELGRACAPVPFLSSAVLATTALTVAADASDTSAPAVIDELLTGQIAAVVVPATTCPLANYHPTVIEHGDGTVSGAVTNVVGADCADVLIVPAVAAEAVQLYLVDPAAAGVSVTRRVSLDLTRPVSEVALTRAPAQPLTAADVGSTALRKALESASVLLASEAVGVADWALDEAVDYMKVRHQFGKPIGSYQALRHRAAQMWITNAQARAAAIYAAACAASDHDDRRIAMILAKSYCGANAVTVAELSLQLHGGIGFTWESSVHFRLKRALAISSMLGSADQLHAALGPMIEITG